MGRRKREQRYTCHLYRDSSFINNDSKLLDQLFSFTGLNMSEDELLLLQSLVLACQSHDHQAVLELESELYPYFDTEQKELLHKLIQVVSTQ